MRKTKSTSRLGRRGRMVLMLFALLPSFLAFTGLAPTPAAAAETFVTVVDDQGPDQLDQANDPGNSQQDITGARIGNEGSFGWAWDETDLSGNNSIDTCTYFEEADGTVISVCYSVQFDPGGTVTAGFPTFEVYDCGTTYDGAQQKCTGNNPVSTDYVVSCGDPVQVPSYFTPDDQPDLQADCTLTLANGDPADNLLLLNTCTKTSASPSSNSNDCLFSDAVGFLQLVKVVADGDASPGDFTLTAGTLTGPGPLVPLSPVTADTPQALSESSPLIDDGTYQLAGIVCTDLDSGAVVDSSSGSVTVGVGQRVECVFTNEVAFMEDPSIGIEKTPDTQTIESGGTANFTIEVTNTGNVDLSNVSVTDVLAPGCDATFATLAVGATETYTCSLAGVTDGFTNVADVSGTSPEGTTVTATDDAVVAVVAGSILIEKTPDSQIVETGGTATFSISVTNNGEVDLTDVTVSDPAAPGCDATFASLAVGATETYTCSLADVTADFTNTATASGTTPGGNTVEDSDTADVDVVTPSILIEKTPDSQIVETGGTATFSISVTNNGEVDLTDVTVSDPAAPGCDATFASLAVGATETYTCSLADVTADFTNTATASGTTPGGNTVEDSDTADVDVVTPSILIEKTPDSQIVETGGTATFSISVTNNGEVDLTDVTVSDPAAPGCDATFASLAVGATETYTCSLADVTADFTNTATASGTTPGGNTVEDSDTADVDVVTPSILIEKTPDNQTIRSGDTATFSISVTNNGEVDLTDVTVSDPAAPGCDATFASLAVGATETYTCSLADVTADFTNTATVTGTTPAGGTVTDSDDADVDVINPSIDIDKIGSDPNDADGASEGDLITYTFVVANTGDSVLTNVTVSDPLPGLSAVTCDATTTNGETFDGNGTGTLGVGDSVECSATYALTQSDIDSGSVNNTATAAGTPPVGPDVEDEDPETVDITPFPSIDLVKSASVIDTSVVAPADRADAGDQVTYTFTITNDGNVTLTGVDLDDALVGFADAVCGGVEELAPGESTDCSAVHDLTQAEIDAGSVTNNADACGDDPAGVEVCDEDTTTTTIPQDPSIDLVKSASVIDTSVVAPADRADAGDQVTYTFTITNDGNVTLTGVDLDDALVGFADAVCGGVEELAPGESTDCSAVHDLTQAEIDAGSVTNNADACGDDPAGVEVCDEDTTTTTIPQDPSIDLVKSASVIDTSVVAPADRADAGDQVTYTFTITNDGNVTLTGVDLDDALVGFADAVCGGVEELAPGESTDCSAVHDLTQAEIDAGSVTNNADACGDDPAGVEVCDEDTTTTTIPQDPSIDLVKSASVIDTSVVAPADRADAGDQVTYTFTITNDGNVTLTGVDLDDALVGFADAVCGGVEELAPGESTDCSAVHDLTQAEIDAGSVTNNADACGDDPAGVEVCDEDTTTTTIPQEPDHTLTKTFDPDQVNVGDTGTFTLVYTNTGNVTLSDVSITDAVDPTLDVQTVQSDDATCNTAQNIVCTADSLAPGESATVTVTYIPLSPLADFEPDPNQTTGVDYLFIFENGYTLVGSTDDGSATLFLGDDVVDPSTYTIEGRNQDIFFIPPGEEEGFQLHLSCSEIFIDGYGASGPTAADHPDWKILGYKVNRYNTNGFFKDCGQTFAPIDVNNVAEATSTPAGGTLTPNPITAEASVEVINPAPIEVTRKRVRRGAVEVQYFNTSQEDLEIEIIQVEWDDPSVTLIDGSYQDGVDLGISGTSPQIANIDTDLPARSKDWLKLDFSSGDAPDGLVITITTSTGSTLVYDYHNS